jgi:catechol 2,3-dioxygenase-like lactoylglutathione lyase family enzyme
MFPVNSMISQFNVWQLSGRAQVKANQGEQLEKSRIKRSKSSKSRRRRMFASFVVSLLLSIGAQAQNTETVQPLMWQAGMTRSEVGEVNVFRRFSADRRAKMEEFYNDVLVLKALPSSALGGNNMIRYPVGHSEVKLFPVAKAAENRSAPVQKTIGIRLVTLFYSDEAKLVERFKAHGYEQPQFRRRDSGPARAALVQDPDGQWVEVVVVPGAKPESLNRFEIGITAGDLEKSRAFYRDFMGLEESKFRDDLLDASGYSYRHGDVTINVLSFGSALPRDTDTAGIQYITWNIEGVDKVAKARAAKIDRPLSAGSPRTIWLLDPDGVSNYFAQFAGTPR